LKLRDLEIEMRVGFINFRFYGKRNNDVGNLEIDPISRFVLI